MHFIRGLGSKFGEDCTSPFTHYVASFLGFSFFQLLCKLVRNLAMRLTDERMGYFRCVFQVVADFGGQIPRTADELMKSLPGVGRYTASMFEYIKLMLPPTPLPNPLHSTLQMQSHPLHLGSGVGWWMGMWWECSHDWELWEHAQEPNRPWNTFGMAFLQNWSCLASQILDSKKKALNWQLTKLGDKMSIFD